MFILTIHAIARPGFSAPLTRQDIHLLTRFAPNWTESPIGPHQFGEVTYLIRHQVSPDRPSVASIWQNRRCSSN